MALHHPGAFFLGDGDGARAWLLVCVRAVDVEETWSCLLSSYKDFRILPFQRSGSTTLFCLHAGQEQASERAGERASGQESYIDTHTHPAAVVLCSVCIHMRVRPRRLLKLLYICMYVLVRRRVFVPFVGLSQKKCFAVFFFFRMYKLAQQSTELLHNSDLALLVFELHSSYR